MNLLRKIGHVIFVILFWKTGFFNGKRLLWWHPTVFTILILNLIWSIVTGLIIGLCDGLERWGKTVKGEKLRSY